MKKIINGFLALIAIIGSGIAWGREQPWRLGVFAFEKPEALRAELTPIVRELAMGLSDPVELLILEQPELDEAIAQRKIDLLFTNPAHYFVLKERHQLPMPHATYVRYHDGQFLDQLGGVIIVRQEAGISDLRDLEEKRILIPGRRFFGGFQAQAYELYQAGVNLQTLQFIEAGSHREVIRRLAAGEAEAGFVRTLIWERVEREHPEWLRSLKVLNEQRNASFPFKLSTQLYPEWPLVILPHVPDEEVIRILAHLWNLHLRIRAYQPREFLEAGTASFTRPHDYTALASLMRTLREPPFEAPHFDWRDIWSKYQHEAIAALVIAGFVALFSAMIVWLYLRLQQAYRQLADEAAERQIILDQLAEGVIIQECSSDTIRYVNQAATAMLGYTAAELIGQKSHALLHHSYPDGRIYPQEQCPIYETCQDGQTRHVESWFWTKEGRLLPVLLGIARLKSCKAAQEVVTVVTDLSEHKRLEAQLRHAATHDYLTNLLNRQGFMPLREQEAARMARHQQAASLGLLDLDHFKRINDTFGHCAGDRVLCALAEELSTSLRATDLIVRWGGEEILILFPETPPEEAVRAVERILATWRSRRWPFAHQADFSITFSAGIAPWYPQQRFEEALAAADEALYRAKSLGRNRVELGLAERTAPLDMGQSA